MKEVIKLDTVDQYNCYHNTVQVLYTFYRSNYLTLSYILHTLETEPLN